MFLSIKNFLVLFLGFILLFPTILSAATGPKFDKAGDLLNETVTPTGISKGSVSEIVGTVIQGALTIVGTIFFLLMLYGGFRWMTARGNEEEITKARNTIIAGIIGLVVIVGAYAITQLVVSTTAKGAGATVTQ